MYSPEPQVSLTLILSGILSLILIITFFVMATRLKAIMHYLRDLSEIEIEKSKIAGMIEVNCPTCAKRTYMLNTTLPKYCKCGRDISENVTEKLEKAKNSSTLS